MEIVIITIDPRPSNNTGSESTRCRRRDISLGAPSAAADHMSA